MNTGIVYTLGFTVGTALEYAYPSKSFGEVVLMCIVVAVVFMFMNYILEK